jgi:type I restriction enzyme M protein
MTDVVARLWGFCHTLRHDGIDYGDYIEQITYLLFLKMADEREIELPRRTDWGYLRKQSGTELRDAYTETLRMLGTQDGILGDIFSGAQSRFTNPVNLKKLIGLIDETEWTSLDVDIKAAAFEGLLEKAAAEGKKGAGQYFTPRLLIQSIVRCIKPDPRASRDFVIGDPACGTGGFLVGAYEWLLVETHGALDRELAKRIRTETYYGQELVPRPRRLALMNLYLHQVEPHIALGDSIYETPSSKRFHVILTNPPFGTRGANQAPDRDDFVIETSNKQLNFIQHVMTTLSLGGRAAMVVPDNVLFADQAGDVFRVLLEECDLHTVLRLPRGTFHPYSPGTATNVIFFTKGPTTERTWIYDGRANVPAITKKSRPLTAKHFAEFERCFGEDPMGRAPRSESDSAEGRWRSFELDEIKDRHYKLDAFKWIRDEEAGDPDDLPEPQELITEAMEELQLALDDFADMQRLLEATGMANAGTPSPNAAQEQTLSALLDDGLFVDGDWIETKDQDPSGEVRLIQLADIGDGVFRDRSARFLTMQKALELRCTFLEPGDVLIARMPDPLGRACIFPGVGRPAVTAVDVCILRPNPRRARPEWLVDAINSPTFRASMQEFVRGTTRQRISRKNLGLIPLAVPNIDEQLALAGLVDRFESKRGAASGHVIAAQRRIESFRRALLAAASSGRLTAESRDIEAEEASESLPQGHSETPETLAPSKGRTRRGPGKS